MPLTKINKIFKIDLLKFKNFHPLAKIDAYDSVLDEEIFDVKEIQVELESTLSDKQIDSYLDKLLRSGIYSGDLTLNEKYKIDSQKNELFYFYWIIKRSQPKTNLNFKIKQDRYEMLSQYIQLLKIRDDSALKNNETFKITIETPNSRNNTILHLPSVDDNNKFISELIDKITEYHFKNWTDLGWYLRLKKKKYSRLEIEAEYKNRPQKKVGRKTDLVGSQDAILLLNLVKTFDQFPSKQNCNSYLTEEQGRFIQRFLSKFGISDKSFIITDDESILNDDISYNKWLRKEIIKFTHASK